MRIINFLLLFLLLGCRVPTTFTTSDESQSTVLMDRSVIYMNGPYSKYDSYANSVYQTLLLEKYNKKVFYSTPRIFGWRNGQLINGKQHGYWQSTRGDWIFRQEYFKMGLRDSVYRIYNAAGDTIYSTYFNMGTGIEKDYHRNGQLYYEIALKDGYFTDTLRIYDEQGRIAEKLYFEKDSLSYYKSFSYPELSDYDEESNFFEEKAFLYRNGAYFNPKPDPRAYGPIHQFLSIHKDTPKKITTSNLLYFGTRKGNLKAGKQEGLWLSMRDTCIIREESFKKGLRHGYYRIYNTVGDTIYSTDFKMGTGVEKDFHENGQLYYEIELKDGYFTDTLRIYDKQGRISEKLYFEKDSLVDYQSFSYPE